MLAASDRRAEAVLSLWAEGMPIRKIAEVIGVSPSVSQRLLEKARESRPRLSRREGRVFYEPHRAVAEKIARQRTRRSELEHAIRAATEIIRQDAVVIIGSQAILGSFTEEELPTATTLSVEVDISPLNAGTIGESCRPIYSWSGGT